MTWKNNRSTVHSFCLFDKGTLLATGGWGDIAIWDLRTSKQLKTIPICKQKIGMLVCSKDGSTAAALIHIVRSMHNEIVCCNLNTGKILGAIRSERSYYHYVAIAPSGAIIAAGCLDGTIEIWNTQKMNQVTVLPK